MRIVIIGGHLAPALSILEALPKTAKVLFIGRKYALEGDSGLSLEYKTITALGIPFAQLNTGRLQRKITRFTLSSLLKFPFGIIQSFFILLKFKPDIVLGFGGYVSIPVVFGAFLLRTPVVIHEQTMEAGLANKLISSFVTKICISWQNSKKYFPQNKVVMTGNPIRKFSIPNSQFSIFKNNLPIIYVTGGSSGSHFINVLIEGTIKELLRSCNVIHQTGDACEYRDFERLKILKENLPEELKENYILEKFIAPSEVGTVLNSSSLVICRAGMNTVSELIYFQKPALLIPLPFSQNNEQLKNAEFLEKIGLGVVLKQSELTGEKLLQSVKLMFHNINNYKIVKEEFKNSSIKNAAKNIINVINNVYKSKTAKIS